MGRAALLALVPFIAARALALQPRPLMGSSSFVRRAFSAVLCATPEQPKQSSSDEDTSLLDAFKARLDEEGGATSLRVSTDAKRLQRAASTAADSVKSALELDQSQSAPSVSGRLLDKENWTLTVAFLGLVIVLSFFTAFTTAQPGEQVSPQQQAGRQTSGYIDTFTSDGGELMFGRR